MMEDWKIFNRLTRRRDAYRRLFLGDSGKPSPNSSIVLKDLKSFCRSSSIIGYRTATGALDPIAMANANGRREVYDRIMRQLYLKDEAQVQLETIKEDDYA